MSPKLNLVFDIGMSEGNDTAFYLEKGFDVVGVEADPMLQVHLKDRFKNEIERRRLTIVDKAAAERSGEEIVFYTDNATQGHSSIFNPHSKSADKLTSHSVKTISWEDLEKEYGSPYYMKIDIEGAEGPFLAGMLATVKSPPRFISSEIMNFEPIKAFHDMGYTKFRIINQAGNNNVSIPCPALEGRYVENPDRYHWSGLFGRELPGSKWFSFEEITRIHSMLHELWTYETLTVGWLDCHACYS